MTTSTNPAPQETPTVVLVHGAFAESSSWNGVIEQLRDEGYPVVAAATRSAGCAPTPSSCAASWITSPVPSCWPAIPTGAR